MRTLTDRGASGAGAVVLAVLAGSGAAWAAQVAHAEVALLWLVGLLLSAAMLVTGRNPPLTPAAVPPMADRRP